MVALPLSTDQADALPPVFGHP